MTLVNSPRGGTCSFEKMNMLFNYFIPKDGLPIDYIIYGLHNPRESLSSAINSQGISSANRTVEAELAVLQKSTAKRKARAPYNRWHSFIMCSFNFCIWLFHVFPSFVLGILHLNNKIVKYASIHDVIAAARHFSRKLLKQNSETTV